jgi:opacity protein-like surface antigen
MKTRYLFAALAAGCLSLAHNADAHGVAGDHMFVSTLIIDDPNVADEASLPTFSYLPQPSDTNPAPGLYGLNAEFDKRITENFGFGIASGYNWLTQPGAKTATGWSNLEVTLKYKPYVNPEHEFMLSVGVVREFARTGANGTNGGVLDNADSSSTTPRIYFGKGFGDLPIGLLRPFALTGELGYTIADKKLKVDPVDGTPINNGIANGWNGGLSLQYSMRYLSSQVKDYGLPTFVNRLTPLVEVAWSSSASKPNQDSTQYLFGVGVNYTAQAYAVSIEALIPGNKQTGSHVGVIAQFHLYFDDILPNSLGKPIAEWF